MLRKGCPAPSTQPRLRRHTKLQLYAASWIVSSLRALDLERDDADAPRLLAGRDDARTSSSWLTSARASSRRPPRSRGPTNDLRPWTNQVMTDTMATRPTTATA